MSYLEAAPDDRIALLLVRARAYGAAPADEALPLWRRLIAIEPAQASHHLQAARCLMSSRRRRGGGGGARGAGARSPLFPTPRACWRRRRPGRRTRRRVICRIRSRGGRRSRGDRGADRGRRVLRRWGPADSPTWSAASPRPAETPRPPAMRRGCCAPGQATGGRCGRLPALRSPASTSAGGWRALAAGDPGGREPWLHLARIAAREKDPVALLEACDGPLARAPTIPKACAQASPRWSRSAAPTPPPNLDAPRRIDGPAPTTSWRAPPPPRSRRQGGPAGRGAKPPVRSAGSWPGRRRAAARASARRRPPPGRAATRRPKSRRCGGSRACEKRTSAAARRPERGDANSCEASWPRRRPASTGPPRHRRARSGARRTLAPGADGAGADRRSVAGLGRGRRRLAPGARLAGAGPAEDAALRLELAEVCARRGRMDEALEALEAAQAGGAGSPRGRRDPAARAHRRRAASGGRSGAGRRGGAAARRLARDWASIRPASPIVRRGSPA